MALHALKTLWRVLRNLPIEWLTLVVCLSSLRWFVLIPWVFAWIAHKRSQSTAYSAMHASPAFLIIMQYPLWQLTLVLSNMFSLPSTAELTDVGLGVCAAAFYAWFEWFRTELRGGVWTLLGELATMCGFGICFYRVLHAFIV